MACYQQLGGCCAPALGQLDPGASAAVVAPELPYPGSDAGGSSGLPMRTLGQLFFLSVAAGLTVWAVTKLLDRRGS
jgi:hypothetical protein